MNYLKAFLLPLALTFLIVPVGTLPIYGGGLQVQPAPDQNGAVDQTVSPRTSVDLSGTDRIQQSTTANAADALSYDLTDQDLAMVNTHPNQIQYGSGVVGVVGGVVVIAIIVYAVIYFMDHHSTH